MRSITSAEVRRISYERFGRAISRGVNVDAQRDVTIGGDVVGRDKISSTQTTDTGGGANIGGNVTVEGGSEFAGRDIFKVINNFFTGTSEEVRDRRNKLILLNKVKKFWIEGVLEQSVYNAAMIELGKEVRPEAVERPWDMVLETPDKEPRTLPKGQKVSEIFEQMDRALLILGEPGSGKTVTLLELARETIPLVEKDSDQPIPVVFNLSSWAERRLPLQDWLVEELNTKYQIPRKIGRTWIEQDGLMLLLDSLDEVKAEHRKECVEVINYFREDHGLAYIAVCSRITDYEALATLLKLRGAILIQPLSREQIQLYLESAGPQLTALRNEMQRDTELPALAQSPLMLSLMSLAYQDASADAFASQQSPTSEEHRRKLFGVYVQRMLQRRGNGVYYHDRQVVEWLIWLAQKMQRTGRSVLLMDSLQPDWLDNDLHKCEYLMASRLVIGILLGVVFIPQYSLSFGIPIDAIISFLALYPIFTIGIIFAVIDSILLVLAKTGHDVGIAYLGLKGRMIYLVMITAIATPVVEWLNIRSGDLTPTSSNEVFSSYTLAAFCAIVWALLLSLRVGIRNMTNDIQPSELLRWSFSQSVGGIVLGFLFGLGLSVFYAVLVFRNRFPSTSFLNIISYLPSYYMATDVKNNAIDLMSIFGGALIGAILLSIQRKVISTDNASNLGIRLSVKRALTMGTLALVAVAVLTPPIEALFLGEVYDPIFLWIDFAIVVAFWYGGIEVIRHYTLRFMLWRQGHMPWNYARFLDYCVDRIFLRHIGGGYIFIHRYLLEYFASLEPEK